MLDLERKTYAARAEDWLRRYPGKFVVVKGDQLLGTYDSIEEALAVGASHFGMTPFLVRCLERESEPVRIPALELGLLRAGS